MFTYTEAKGLLKEFGRFEVNSDAWDDYTMFYITTEDGEEYMVGTDNAADIAWDEYIESYIDDCILPDLDEALACYFDRESFKRDASYDGRGHSLSSYDGSETDIQGTDFVAFRIG